MGAMGLETKVTKSGCGLLSRVMTSGGTPVSGLGRFGLDAAIGCSATRFCCGTSFSITVCSTSLTKFVKPLLSCTKVEFKELPPLLLLPSFSSDEFKSTLFYSGHMQLVLLFSNTLAVTKGFLLKLAAAKLNWFNYIKYLQLNY